MQLVQQAATTRIQTVDLPRMHRTTHGDVQPVNAKSDLADRHLSSVVTDFMKMLSADRAEISCKLPKGGLKPLYIEQNVPTWF